MEMAMSDVDKQSVVGDMDSLLERMWVDYLSMNPQARQVRELFESRGETVVNDHIALRTFNLPPVHGEALARAFLSSGYEARGSYSFPEKHLRARHYEAPGRPRVFISELLVEELPPRARSIVEALVRQVDPALVLRFDLCTLGRPWKVTHQDWLTLAEGSEYAAWVAAHGFRPNHFTVSVNGLGSLSSIQEVNQLLLDNGIALNASGGLVKGTPDQLLEQSSTLANEVPVEFEDGTFQVPGCYYEFARRYPAADGSLYGGFIAASANRIFESTDRVER